MHEAGRNTLSDDGRESEHPVAAEKDLVDVAGEVTDVDVSVLVDAYDPLFVA